MHTISWEMHAWPTCKARIQLARPQRMICVGDLCQHLLQVERQAAAALLPRVGRGTVNRWPGGHAHRLAIQQRQCSCSQGFSHLKEAGGR